MKFRTTIITLFIISIVLVLQWATVAAQEGTEEITIPADLSGTAIQMAVTGAFEANEDGTYTLTLGGVASYLPIYTYSAVPDIRMPGIRIGRYLTAGFVNDWNDTEGTLSAPAILDLATVSFVLTLTSPTYTADDATITYVATVDEIRSFGDEEVKDPPSEFADATLFIVFDSEFVNGLFTTAGGIRDTGTRQTCPNGLTC